MSEATGDTSGVAFGTDEETRLILQSLDEFVESEVAPIADELIEAMREVRRRSAEAGFYAMNMPEEVGGDDVSTVTWYRANRHLAAMGTPLTGQVLAGPEGPKPLLAQAEGEQVERYLDPVMRAEKSTGFG